MQEGKGRVERERVVVESILVALMYSAPPYCVAEQVSKVREERVSVCPEERVAEIAPPFSDEQSVNVTPVIV